jgi:magnesium-protoporphyrin IX monomethyl ester (oxidative) cyclase
MVFAKNNSCGTLLMFPPNNMGAVLGKGKAFIKSSAPLGLLYIAAVLEQHGEPVEFLDAFASGFGVNEVVAAVKDKNPRLLGISSLTSDAPVTTEILRRLRKEMPGLKILLGNHHPAVFAQWFLEQNLADFVCPGEGEYATLELLRVLREGGDLSSVPGIIWRDDRGGINVNARRPDIADLNELPMPARHLAPMERYRISFYFGGGRSEGLITSRGCPNRCAFCTVHKGSKPRYRKASLMVEELVDCLHLKYHYKHAFFMDSLFMGHRQRIFEFCDIMKRRKRRPLWSCEGHVNFVDERLLREMKAAGCYSVSFGIESGVQRLLDNVNKKQKLARIKESVILTKKAGIKTNGLFILGLPGERPEDTEATINFALSLPLDFAQFSIFTPYPGCQIFYELVESGQIDPMDWGRYSAYPMGNLEPIYSPPGLSSGELKRYQRKALRRFYLRPAQIGREALKLRPGNFAEALGALWSFFRL